MPVRSRPCRKSTYNTSSPPCSPFPFLLFPPPSLTMTCKVHLQPTGGRPRREIVVTHSSGAVIASEVVVRGACVDEACSKFNRLARQIFPSRPRRYTFLGQSWDLLSTWVADSRYDSGALDRALQEAFGPTRRLFDTTIPLVSGIRIALTASQVDDGSLCLFTNYRAAGRSSTWSAHSVLASNDEPLLWEVLVVTPSPHPTPSPFSIHLLYPPKSCCKAC